ncbi:MULTISPECIES: hypothetical protein [unclassified Mesorhizobium]|uniref:hypothetical protein n=1 Tax=unclassified Mesorhizobium TaxID=325217 RepID=UPI0012EC6C7E|nr:MULTISPECIES: hypothetical protein [unclassified Mesorhizobium]WJI80803.1 hypothetical protein NLY34_28955 [Mesorhizobium sp. C374B]WJI87342.1 hypothetical protein NLY42_31350 [Mesorhizobium sp. C372A]
MGERARIALVAVVVIGFVWIFKGPEDVSPVGTAASSGVNAGVYEGCAKINPKAVLASWDNTIDRIRRSDATGFSGPGIFVHVSTERWMAAGHDGRLSIAIAAYCDAADAHGKGVAIIKGSLDENLGGVVDGNYTSH